MRSPASTFLKTLIGIFALLAFLVSCKHETEIEEPDVVDPYEHMTATFFPAVVQMDQEEVTVNKCDTDKGEYQLAFDNSTPEIKKGSVVMIENNVVLVTDTKTNGNVVDIKGQLGDLSYVFHDISFTLCTNAESVETRAGTVENVYHPQMIICDGDTLDLRTKTREEHSFFGDDFKLWDKTYSKTAELYKSDNAKVTATPTLSSSMNVAFDFEFLDKIEVFVDALPFLKSKQFNFTGRLYGDLTTAINLKADISKSGKIEGSPSRIVKNLLPTKTLVFMIGAMPIFIHMGCDLFTKADMEYSGELHYNQDLSATYTFEEGISYKPYSYYQVTDKWSRFDSTTDFPAPQVSGKASWTGQVWVYPRFFARLEYIIGPSFEIKPYLKANIAAGFAEGEVDITKNYLANTAKAHIGIDAAVGVSSFIEDLGSNPDDGMIDLGTIKEWEILRSPYSLRLVSSSSDKVRKGQELRLKFQVNEKSFAKELPSPFFPIVKIEIPKTGEYYYCFTKTDGTAEFTRIPKSSDEIIYAKIFDANGEVVDQLQFGDGSMPEPKVSTGSPHDVKSTSAVIPVSWESEATVKEIGVYYSSTSSNPSLTDKYAKGNMSTMEVALNQLTPNTRYYARSYLKVDLGEREEVIVGDVVEFTTLEEAKPAIEVDAISLDFGNIKVGEKATGSFNISNPGSANLTVNLSGGGGAYSINWTSGTIKPGGNQKVTVTFAPDKESSFNSSVRISSNAGSDKIVSLSGSGIVPVQLAPEISVSKTSLSFGKVKKGESNSLTVTVKNTGNADLKVSVNDPGSPYSLSWREATIKPNTSKDLTVRFSPEAAADFGARLQFTSNATNGTKYVTLSGSGYIEPEVVQVPKIGISSSSLSFGSITVGETGTQQVTISNTGDKALTIRKITCPTGFSASWSSATIAPNGSKALSVTFSPTSAASFNGNLVIESDASNGTSKTIALSGTGLAKPEPKLSVSPSVLDFGEQIKFTQESKTITISNSGTGTLNITSISKSSDYGDLFSISGWTSGGSIAAGASKTITVSFQPLEDRTYEETLTIVSSNATNNKTQTIRLRGTGVPEPENPVIKFSVSSMDFGNVEAGESVTKSFSISNTGTTTLNITSIKVVATDNTQNPDYLTISPNSACTIAAGKSKSFTVTFSPEGVRNYGATIAIKSNATNATQGTSTLNISGAGIQATSKVLTASPSSLAFGMQTIGNMTHKNFTVKNTGTKAVTLYSMEATDGFIVDQTWEEGNSLGLAAGASKTFSAYFAPTETKSYSGQIVIKSNASNGDLIIPLSGTGAEAQGYIEITSGENLEFGDVNVGASSALYTKIKNTGEASLKILGIDCPDGFSATCSVSTISAGYNATISVSFSPTQVKAYSGSVIVRTDAENGSIAIGVSGNGLQTMATSGFVDMGLSVKWAATNIGASKPEEAGHFVAWGETSTKSTYTYKNYKYYNSSTYVSEQGWITKYCDFAGWGYKGYTDALKLLTYDDDFAQSRLGGLARIPTRKEWEELKSNCTWTWTDRDGKNGYQVTSKINGNTIFIPAGGIMDTYAEEVNETGYYWTSDLYRECTDAATWEIWSTKSWYSSEARHKGLTVRAVEDYEAPPRIFISVTGLDFTGTKLGTSASQTIAVSNTGKGTLHITGINTTKRWSVDWQTATIAPGQHKNLTITYTPTKDDSLVIEDELTWDWSSISIDSDAANDSHYIISVKGYGVE